MNAHQWVCVWKAFWTIKQWTMDWHIVVVNDTGKLHQHFSPTRTGSLSPKRATYALKCFKLHCLSFPSNHVNDLHIDALPTAHNNYNQIHWQPIFVYAFVTNSLMANLLNGSKIKCATPTHRHRQPIANTSDVGLARTASMTDLRTLYNLFFSLQPAVCIHLACKTSNECVFQVT